MGTWTRHSPCIQGSGERTKHCLGRDRLRVEHKQEETFHTSTVGADLTLSHQEETMLHAPGARHGSERCGGTNQVGHCCAVAFSSSVGCLTTIFFESVAEPPDMRMADIAAGRRRPMLENFPAGIDEANAGASARHF